VVNGFLRISTNKNYFGFCLISIRKDFGKALKQYIRSLNEKPKTYVVTCAKRKIDIKITKMKRSIWDWVYGTFYGR
jgi:hypothetical protein